MTSHCRTARQRVAAGLLLAAFLAACGAKAVAEELVFDLRIVRGRIAEAMRLVRVKEGDTVRLRLTSDRPVTLHLHGYDIERRVLAGAPAEIRFTASATGRFPLHAHTTAQTATAQAHDEAPLAVVEVYPR